LEAFISKHGEYSDSVVEQAMEEEFDLAPEVEEALKTDQCTECKSTDTRVLDLGIKMFFVCNNCKFRKPLS
jgi:hypothetical protein